MSDGGAEPVLVGDNLRRVYREGPQELEVLAGVSLCVNAGESVAVIGHSGSGKTTLLNILGGLDLPTSGEVRVGGRSLSAVGERERSRIRNAGLGFIYQLHHLLPEFTALENVALPLMIGGSSAADAASAAREMLGEVGLAARLEHKPGELSGGERQRVAIARALVTRPGCVLADEPTGNLDRGTARGVQELMLRLNRELGISFVVVTHDEELAGLMGRRMLLESGRLREA